MRILEINMIQIEISDNTINTMRKYNMNTKQEILIRNKHDADKLSRRTTELLEISRRERLKRALNDDDMLYINSIFENVSIIELAKEIIFRRIKRG